MNIFDLNKCACILCASSKHPIHNEIRKKEWLATICSLISCDEYCIATKIVGPLFYGKCKRLIREDLFRFDVYAHAVDEWGSSVFNKLIDIHFVELSNIRKAILLKHINNSFFTDAVKNSMERSLYVVSAKEILLEYVREGNKLMVTLLTEAGVTL